MRAASPSASKITAERRRPPHHHDAGYDEFIRRFLIHVLPKGQHRIRHYGFFGNGNRAANIARIRRLLGAKTPNQGATMTTATATVTASPRPRAALPMLRRTTDHRRTYRASTAPQSTANNSKGRCMTRAPHITNDTLSRTPRRLRTNRHAQIKLSRGKSR